MSDLALFLVGVAVTIPAAIAILGLVAAAVADGRDDERSQADLATSDRIADWPQRRRKSHPSSTSMPVMP